MSENTVLQLAMEAQESLIKAQADLQRLIKAMAKSGIDEGVPVRSSSMGSEGDGLTLIDLRKGDFRYTKPSILRLPHAPPMVVKTWKEVVEEIVGWLVDHGHVIKDSPLGGRRQVPVVSRDRMRLSQSHGNPDSYISRHDDWWIDTWGNVNTKARNLMAICESVGVDPAEFHVKLRTNAGRGQS
jgi:hypothetical protein